MNHVFDPRAAALEIGERLTEAPSKRLVDVAFARELDAQSGLADAIGWVDLAHTLCLANSGVIPNDAARVLVAALLELADAPSDFTLRPECGDLYTNREAWLSARTKAAGWLGFGRARREALTTAYQLTVCDELLDLGEALAGAIETLSHASLRHAHSPAPDYTYLQAAQPTSFGHYLQSFTWPMSRDLDRAMALYARFDRCPAGVGASNGSALAPMRRELAERLGFAALTRHARDAMWQSDLAIEACAVAVAAAVNLDRLAEDLMIFATGEFGFAQLADRHARASKIMPQKRNPFALAYIRAAANRLIGLQAGVAAASRTPSGQMDNRLFVYGEVPAALREAAEAALLMAECVDGLRFDEKRALAALADGSVCASDLAERLAAFKIDARAAHGVIGGLVQRLEEEGRTLSQARAEDVRAALDAAALPSTGVSEDWLASALNSAACIAARTDVGGAAPEETAAMARELTTQAASRRRDMQELRMRRAEALARLRAEAEDFARADA